MAQVYGIIADDARPGAQRTNDLTYLSSLLLAHNTAEENTVYPALAAAGMWVPADVLYLQQSHGKIAYYGIGANAGSLTGTAWTKAITDFQASLVEHATVHEEGDYFPKLQAALTTAQNSNLTALYMSYFDAVIAF